MEKRIEWVDLCKGLLIILVVFAHSLQEIYKIHSLDFTNDWFRNMIYSFHMPAFMAMSGYLVYKPNMKDTSFQNLSNLILRRFKQLIIPLAIWTIPLAIVKESGYFDLILFPNAGYWFLWALFFIIVVFNAVDIFAKKTNFKQEIVVPITVCVLMIIQMIIPNPKFLGYEYIAYYFLFYMMGYYANKYKNKLPSKVPAVSSVFILWFVMACYWTPNNLPFFLQNVPFIPSKMLQLIYRILTPIVFILAMYSIAPKIRIGESIIWKQLIECGKMSLGIYLVHMVVKQHLSIFLVDTFSGYPLWCYIVIEFILMILFSYCVVKLLQKFSFTNKWLLGRF